MAIVGGDLAPVMKQFGCEELYDLAITMGIWYPRKSEYCPPCFSATIMNSKYARRCLFVWSCGPH